MSTAKPIRGEVIPYSRGAILHASLAIIMGLLALCLGVILEGLLGSFRWVHAIEIPLCLCPSVLGLVLIGLGWIILRGRRRLILGADRMQLLEGHTVAWDIPYANVARVVLAPEPDGDFYVGIELLDREPFDRYLAQFHWLWRYPSARLRKKYGFDVVLTPAVAEPIERVYEAVLTCLHRYRRLAQENS